MEISRKIEVVETKPNRTKKKNFFKLKIQMAQKGVPKRTCQNKSRNTQIKTTASKYSVEKVFFFANYITKVHKLIDRQYNTILTTFVGISPFSSFSPHICMCVYGKKENRRKKCQKKWPALDDWLVVIRLYINANKLEFHNAEVVLANTYCVDCWSFFTSGQFTIHNSHLTDLPSLFCTPHLPPPPKDMW